MDLTGIHHLTAITADAPANHAFYTRVLGMRLVKKTVNQDDTSAYHLFYADGLASPGTDLTFFDWPVQPERRGTGSVIRTGLRVSGPGVLDYWAARLAEAGITPGPPHERDGRRRLEFEDREGQRLALIDDGGAGAAHPWAGSPVPPAHQIRGLGPLTLSVPRLEPSAAFFTDALGLRAARRYQAEDGVAVQVLDMAAGEGGPGAELHLRADPSLPPVQQGAGAVHHLALRVPDAGYDYWVDRYRRLGLRSSGPVDRFYFRSLYVREPGGILVEIATDGPGFATDEPLDRLGETLSLPPFLEPGRAGIERKLKPLG